eukprot:366327-Chlamydomonas_euryale.AAC.3
MQGLNRRSGAVRHRAAPVAAASHQPIRSVPTQPRLFHTGATVHTCAAKASANNANANASARAGRQFGPQRRVAAAAAASGDATVGVQKKYTCALLFE